MMMGRLYETILIAKPDFDQDNFNKLHQRLLKTIGDEGGMELKLVDWGRRRLAYPIDGHRKGNYFYFGFIAAPTCVSEMHRQIRISGEVIRFQTVALTDSKPLGAFDIEDERKRVVGLTPDPQDDEEHMRRDRRRDSDLDDDDDSDDDEEDLHED